MLFLALGVGGFLLFYSYGRVSSWEGLKFNRFICYLRFILQWGKWLRDLWVSVPICFLLLSCVVCGWVILLLVLGLAVGWLLSLSLIGCWGCRLTSRCLCLVAPILRTPSSYLSCRGLAEPASWFCRRRIVPTLMQFCPSRANVPSSNWLPIPLTLGSLRGLGICPLSLVVEDESRCFRGAVLRWWLAVLSQFGLS